MSEPRRVVLVAGARTPFAKATAHLRDISAADLSKHAIDGLLARTGVDPESVQELHWGVVVVDPNIPHLGKDVAFRSKLPVTTRAVTYTDNCISGTTAMVAAHDAIALGRIDVAIAGGVESMSNTPLLFGRAAAAAFREANVARDTMGKLRALSKLRPLHFAPAIPSVAEPSTGLTMGDHCELMVKEWRIPRELQDQIAYRSHMRAAAATDDGRLKAEIVPLQGLDHDPMVRPTTTLEKLASLKPVFDKSPTGTLTAGNSSPLTDGASAVMLMSEEAAEKHGLTPLAYIEDFEHAAIAPDDGLLMGPGVAVPRLLRRHGLSLNDIDIVEVHEAFGGQVGCNLAAWEKGWKEPAIGTVDIERLNPLGSSISIGHPFAATGGRIATTLANELHRRDDATWGLISICAAGAQAGAMLLKRA